MKVKVCCSIDSEKKKKIWDNFENKSAFIEICLDNAVDILYWDSLKKAAPEHYQPKDDLTFKDLVKDFNRKNTLNFLNQAKKGLIVKEDGEWRRTNSQKKAEL